MIKSKHYCDWCGKEIECADIVITHPQHRHTNENGLVTCDLVLRPGPQELCCECSGRVWMMHQISVPGITESDREYLTREITKILEKYEDDTPCINARNV